METNDLLKRMHFRWKITRRREYLGALGGTREIQSCRFQSGSPGRLLDWMKRTFDMSKNSANYFANGLVNTSDYFSFVFTVCCCCCCCCCCCFAGSLLKVTIPIIKLDLHRLGNLFECPLELLLLITLCCFLWT